MTRRNLHPVAWWAWAIALGASAARTRNPLLLGLILAVAWLVVAARRVDAPWARSFGSFLRIGLFIVGVRVVLQVLFGTRLPGHVLFTVPGAELPDWLSGLTLGGPVTVEALVVSVYEGLQLAVLLACVGAANSLASPYRLLRSLPSVLYEAGVVVTVALAFAPQASATAQNVRAARRLRGRPHKGLRGLRGMAVPVLEGALERSLHLASSMDARGYGRKGLVAPGRRRATQIALAVGLLAAAAGIYGILDAGSPSGLGLPALACGAALLAISLMLGGGRSARTRYRPDPWRIPEWTTVVAGMTALAGVAIAASVGVRPHFDPPVSPVEIPLLPLLPAVCVLAAAVPAFATPEPA